MASSGPVVYIHDHTPYLKKSSRRRIIMGQSISATTFLAVLLVAIPGALISFITWKLTGFLNGWVFIRAVVAGMPTVFPVFATYALLESRTGGDTFLGSLKKRWVFRSRSNWRTEDGEKFMYAIGMSPKMTIIKGDTLFMASVVEVPSHVSNLSGFIDGQVEDSSLTIKLE